MSYLFSFSSFLSIDLGNPFKGISKDAEEEISKKKKKKKLHNNEEEEEKAANTAKLLLRFSPSNLINQTLIRLIIINHHEPKNSISSGSTLA